MALTQTGTSRVGGYRAGAVRIGWPGESVAPTGFKPYWIQDDEIKTMKKNVASQSVGTQMITISDGSIFTGTVTLEITKDNGAQTGSAGTAPAHEGNGYHSYSPTQAESNADHIAFTFSGSGALSKTVQVYTDFPQTADNDTKLTTIADDVANIDGAAMRGTDGANTVVPPSVSQFNARTLVAANYFDFTTDLVDITQTAADKSWSTAARVLTAGTNLNDITAASVWAVVTRELTSGNNIVLAKGTGLTGLNDIPATDIVTAGAITTSSGNASVDVVKINGTTVIGAGVGGNLWRA